VSGLRPSPGRLYLLLSLALLFWSFNYIAAKVALRDFPPLLLVALRTALAGFLILPVYFWQGEAGESVWTWKQLRVLVPLGACGVALNQLFFVAALSRTSVAHTGIVNALSPLFVLLIAALIGQEGLSARRVTGMAIAFAGIVVLQLGRVQGSHSTLLGDFYALLGSLFFASFTVFGKSVSRQYGGITVNTVAYVSGGILLAPIIFWNSGTFRFRGVSALGWWSLLYMAAFSSVVAYLLYYYALARMPASGVSAMLYLQPVVATLMAIPLLAEPVNPGLLVGGSLALAGVYVTERS
jgi:drug/metabolite transporter (DMT)-like permease